MGMGDAVKGREIKVMGLGDGENKVVWAPY